MMRQQLPILSLLTLGFSGFFACTFGADEFTIVAADDSGAGANGTGASSSAGGRGAGGEGGRASGSSMAGEATLPAAGDGAGGAGGSGEPTVKYVCAASGTTFPVFTAADLEGYVLDEGVFVAPKDNDVIVIAPTHTSGTDSTSRLYLRGISDSGGGSANALVHYDFPGGRLQVGAVYTEANQLKILAVTGDGVSEIIVPTGANGLDFGMANVKPLPIPDECDGSTGVRDGFLRDMEGSYFGGRNYVVTCSSVEDQLSLHLASGEPPQLQEIAPAATDVNNIIRQYFHIGGQHLLVVGEDVGPRIGIRYGASIPDLAAVHLIGLSDDPNVFSAFAFRPSMNGLFVLGAAFTTDDPNPPPLVPADIYAGGVSSGQIPELFTTMEEPNAPPAPLQKIASYSKASQLVGIDDAIALGQNMLGIGATIAPRDRIEAFFLAPDGTVLAPPTEIYRAPMGSTIGDRTLRVARMGIGVGIIWGEDGAVRARLVNCLQN